jgi:protein tyrosine phosphatase (PTP) superfamily phosphohydrolase (DUF442 family)
MPSRAFNFLRVLSLFGLCATLGCASHPRGVQTEKIVLHMPTAKEGPQQPLEEIVPGVENFGVISKDVWRGAQPTAEGMRKLADLGVKTVIDLRKEDESAEIPTGVRYVRLPTSAWQADRVDVRAVLSAIEKNPKPVFIHCQQGRDRTGLAVAAYRLSQKMSPADACRELRNFHVNPWWDGPISRRVYELSRDGARQ